MHKPDWFSSILLRCSANKLPFLLASALFFVWLPVAMADVVELKTGERVEGKFKQATMAGVVIEVGGQTLTFPLEKVRAIYFGSAPIAETQEKASSQQSAAQVALDALTSLRSVAQAGVTYQQYLARIQDAKIQVDRYLASKQDSDLYARIAEAMDLYLFAGSAWDVKINESSRTPPALLAVDPLAAKCPGIIALWTEPWPGKSTAPMIAMMQKDGIGRGLLLANEGIPEIWKCASAKVDEAQRLMKGSSAK